MRRPTRSPGQRETNIAKTAITSKANTKAKASTKTTAAPAPAPTAAKEVKAEAKKPTRGPTAKRIGRDVIKLERLAHRVEVLAGRREG